MSPLPASIAKGAICVRCARRPATGTLPAANGSKDAVCATCAAFSEQRAASIFGLSVEAARELPDFGPEPTTQQVEQWFRQMLEDKGDSIEHTINYAFHTQR